MLRRSLSSETIYGIIHLPMKSIVTAVSLLVTLAAVAEARSPINLDILQRDGYGVVALHHPRPNELLVRAKINDQPVELILDTGWDAPGNGISLDKDLARALKVQAKAVSGHGVTWAGTKVATEVGMANSVEMGNTRITGVPLFFGNFGGLRFMRGTAGTSLMIPESMGTPRGYISIGFLRATSAVIDLPGLRLYLRPPGTGKQAMIGPALKALGLAEVPLSRATQRHLLVDAEVNGMTGKMAIDTGAEFSMVERRFALKANASWFNARLEARDAAGNSKRADLASIRGFKIGGVPISATNIALANTALGSFGGIVGLIGMDILGPNWGIIDCGQSKLYFSHVK